MKAILICCLLLGPGFALAQQQAPAPVIFFDIAGPDSSALNAFYAAVFHWNISDDGSFSTTVVSQTLMGTIRQDPAETLFYLGVEDIAATLAQVEANGGTVDSPRFEVPGVVVLGLFRDPAGNRVGLVEMENGTATIP